MQYLEQHSERETVERCISSSDVDYGIREAVLKASVPVRERGDFAIGAGRADGGDAQERLEVPARARDDTNGSGSGSEERERREEANPALSRPFTPRLKRGVICAVYSSSSAADASIGSALSGMRRVLPCTTHTHTSYGTRTPECAFT